MAPSTIIIIYCNKRHASRGSSNLTVVLKRILILESGIPLIHQFLTKLAEQQLKKNPKMVDEIINLVQDDEEKQKLISQLQQTQQQQVNLQVSESPKILKVQTDKKDTSFFQNILTALRCWDKKQK